MQAIASLLQRCSTELYLNHKVQLRGQMFAQIAFFVAKISKREEFSSDLRLTNDLYALFLKQALTGNPRASDSFNSLTRLSDERLAFVYGVMKTFGDTDFFAERDMDRSLINFEWEKGALGVEVLRQANSIVNF